MNFETIETIRMCAYELFDKHLNVGNCAVA